MDMKMSLLTALTTSFYDDVTTSPSSLPSCEDFVDNVTAMVNDLDGDSSDRGNMSDAERRYLAAEYVVNKIAAPTICSFGIVGNLLNLLVLTRKRLQCSMDRMEKSAHVGLVSLAVSDLMFCLFYLLTIVVPSQTAYVGGRHWVIGLYYSVYKEAMVNVFALTSTWLTVVMAIGRYVVVCRPLHARGYISFRGTKASIVAVFVLSIALNVPRMLRYDVIAHPCTDLEKFPDSHLLERCSCVVYSKDLGAVYDRAPRLEIAYHVIWFVVAILTPLIILTACNICLIRALQQSRQLQRRIRANLSTSSSSSSSAAAAAAAFSSSSSSSVSRRNLNCSNGRNSQEGKDGSSSSSSHITPTMVALIVVFLICVGPSGVIDFFRPLIHADSSTSGYYSYQTTASVSNCLFLVNFAVNFILYCVVNPQFRRATRDIFCCAWAATGERQRPGRRNPSGYERTCSNNSKYEYEFIHKRSGTK